MFVRRWLAQAVVLAVLSAAAGCSGGSTGTYATVAGTVTHGGVPVEGAKVTFHSTAEAAGEKAGPFSATTDSSGKYLIASIGKEPGIPPGMYKITITKLDMKAENLPKDF